MTGITSGPWGFSSFDGSDWWQECRKPEIQSRHILQSGARIHLELDNHRPHLQRTDQPGLRFTLNLLRPLKNATGP